MIYKVRMISGAEHIVEIERYSNGLSPLVGMVTDRRRMPTDSIEPDLKTFNVVINPATDELDSETYEIILNVRQIESIVPEDQQ
jgi:hypothetical protein